MGLLCFAILGFVAGNGLFIWWLFADFTTLAAVFHDRLALAFIVDALLTLGLLTAYFVRTPPGRYRWPWFLGLSLVGGLCFGLPFYWWLNRRQTPSLT